MIVVAGDRRLELVTQSDHAALAADLLGLWRLDGLPQLRRRRDLLRAVREHDNGWRETDSAPVVDPTSGLPHSFTTLPRELRQELWERGTTRYLDDDPYVALLIVEHGIRIHSRQRGRSDWEEFFDRLDSRRLELLERSGTDETALATVYRFVSLADSLSLILCGRSVDPFRGQGYSARLVDPSTLEVDPFPLAGATTFRLPYRSIPRRTYLGDADLAVEAATARWETRSVRVVPPG